MTTRDVQAALAAAGFNPGPIDGIPGRQTIAAVKAFQSARGLVADGIVGPVTRRALFGDDAPKDAARPWYELALRKIDLHEGKHNAELRAFLKSDGKTLGDPAKLPWCGDLVETCIALTLPSEGLPGNPYLARNWLKFGIECKATLGAVAVFWRGSRHGTSGHVGFVAGGGAGKLYILGGNQSNRISVAPLDTARLLGCRWPKSVPLGATVLPTMKGGKLSTNEA